MRNFEWTVSATQEDWETEEQTRLQVREEFEKQRQYIYSKSPIDKLAEKRILFLWEQLKKKLSDEEYIKVKTEFNNL